MNPFINPLMNPFIKTGSLYVEPFEMALQGGR